MPTAESLVDPSLKSLRSLPSSDIAVSQDAVPLIRKASNDSSLGRSILVAFGKEILEFASDEFLDLALELRLKTINACELVKLLAKADRLGYGDMDTIDDDDDVSPAQEACEGSRSGLEVIGAPKSPSEIAGPLHRHPTASPQSPNPDGYRAPKRLKTVDVQRGESVSENGPRDRPKVRGVDPKAATSKKDPRNNQSMRGVVGVPDREVTATSAAGKQGQRQSSRVVSGRVAAPVTQSRNVSKRLHGQSTRGAHGGIVQVKSGQPRRLVPPSAGKRPWAASAKPTELVVISDSDPESGGDEDG
jgi:hypothetical protein